MLPRVATLARCCHVRYSVACRDLYEFQIKDLLRISGLPVQRSELVTTVDEVPNALEKLKKQGIQRYALKAQVRTGNRAGGIFENGFKGGIRFIGDDEVECLRIASNMLNNKIYTKQTGSEGELCKAMLICEYFSIDSERYICFTIDSIQQSLAVLFSSKGGSEVEDSGISMKKINFSPGYCLNDYDFNTIASGLQFNGNFKNTAKTYIKKLYEIFIDHRLSMLEINPFTVAKETNEIVCFDAKAKVDSLSSYEDFPVKNKSEIFNDSDNTNLIKMNGKIACIGNGAGLTMATMDAIYEEGGSVSLFYDIGGKTSKKELTQALKASLSSDAVILNMFGGIVDCYEIALKVTSIVPAEMKNIVVKLAGQNSENAKHHFETRGIKVVSDLNKAVKYAIYSGAKNNEETKEQGLLV